MTTTKSTTADADARIGERVKAARMAAGLNQTELGGAAGISFQQIQKYETGRDRISASFLQVLAKALGSRPPHCSIRIRGRTTRATRQGSPSREARPRYCGHFQRLRMRPSGGSSLSLLHP